MHIKMTTYEQRIFDGMVREFMAKGMAKGRAEVTARAKFKTKKRVEAGRAFDRQERMRVA